MYCIKRSEAQEYSGDGYSGIDYPSNDNEINFAVIKIEKRNKKIETGKAREPQYLKNIPFL